MIKQNIHIIFWKAFVVTSMLWFHFRVNLVINHQNQAANWSWLTILPRRWRRYIPTKYRTLSELNIVTIQNTILFYEFLYISHRSGWNQYKMNNATSRKVAGSISDEVTGFFNLPNPSSLSMALGSTQPLTEMSTRNLHGGKERPTLTADNLTDTCEPIV
jgi:hypothetical protein